MSAWTKGPWEVGEPDENDQAIVRSESIEIATCWHHCVGAIEKEMHANAHLIAAAPDLYIALEAICDELLNGGTEVDACLIAVHGARAALRKARGDAP